VTAVTQRLYASEVAAANAYDAAALAVFGKSAALNFNKNLLLENDELCGGWDSGFLYTPARCDLLLLLLLI